MGPTSPLVGVLIMLGSSVFVSFSSTSDVLVAASSTSCFWKSGLDGFDVAPLLSIFSLGVSLISLTLAVGAIDVTDTSLSQPLASVLKIEDQLFLFEITNFGAGICVGEYFPGGAMHSSRAVGDGDCATAGNGFVVVVGDLKAGDGFGDASLRVGNGLSAGVEFAGFTAGDFAGGHSVITGDELRGRQVVVSLARRVGSDEEEHFGVCECGAGYLDLGE